VGDGDGVGGFDLATGNVSPGCELGLDVKAAGDFGWAPPPGWLGLAPPAASADCDELGGSETSPSWDARTGSPWPATRSSISVAAPASTASVTATARTQDTARPTNPGSRQ